MVLLKLIQIHEASAAIYKHTVAGNCVNDIVIDDADAHRLTHALLVYSLGLLVRVGQGCNFMSAV